MQTRKKTRDGSASATVMQRAELLQCVVEYLGDEKDLCSAATLCRTARDDRTWSLFLMRLCNEFPQPEYSLPSIPGYDDMDMEAPPGFVRPESREHGMGDPYLSPRFNFDTGVLEFGFVPAGTPVLSRWRFSTDDTLTWVPKVPPLSCELCRFTTDSRTAFRTHCSSWRHCESRRDPIERVPSQFVDPRHADLEGFAQLPAVQQCLALRRHVSTVLRQLHVPLTDALVRANMESLADWARSALGDRERFREDEVQQALAGLTTSSAARACTDFCIDDFKSDGLCPGSFARVAIMDGWADWGPSGSSSAKALLWYITGFDF